MENDAAILYCSNEHCQAANPLTHNFCQQCSTPLPKRYLWAVVNGESVGNPGDILFDRYLAITHQIVLDTQPALLPQTPSAEKLPEIKAYLRLFPYRLHVPQVYGVLPTENTEDSQQEIILLEKPPISAANSSPSDVQLQNDLITAWGEASSMRQLNLLWQLANLWQPLSSEGVTSTLLEAQLIRVEGALIRLLELRQDLQQVPELPQLGEFWTQLLPGAKPAITDLVSEICRTLQKREIHSSEQLIAILDQALTEAGRSQTTSIKIATKSDTGPSRQRNEDACYPQSGSQITKPPHLAPLAIVCDGIGGHEGGNVASNLAIDTIQQQLTKLIKSNENTDPDFIQTQLEYATAVANDKISQRNDSEQRQGRKRMGTTLVMALPIAHTIYVTHVGDSRAYWITKSGCYQVTLDDDVASREVRLGYAVYRDAVQQGASGSLVQALGMSPSSSLHPSVQRFILDEDSVFLLCSDGLSDFDRVEQYWETEILPIITEKLNVANVASNLVELANNINKHDNVTVALIHCQVKYSEPKSNIKAVFTETNSTPSLLAATSYRASTQKTQVVKTSVPKASSLRLELIVPLGLVVAAGAVGLWLMQQRLQPLTVSITPEGTKPKNVETSAPPPDKLDKGWLIKTKSEIQLTTDPLDPDQQVIAPKGTMMQVIEKQPMKDHPSDYSLKLRACNVPSTSGSNANTSQTKPLLQSGEEGWILLSQIQPIIASSSKPGEMSKCPSPSASSTSAKSTHLKATHPEPNTSTTDPNMP